MIPVIVVAMAVIYLVLKATGLLDDLIRMSREFQSGESDWGQKYLDWVQDDPKTQERLEVYKDFFDTQSDDDETAT